MMMCEDPKAHHEHPWTGPRGGQNWCRGRLQGMLRSRQLFVPTKIKKTYFQDSRAFNSEIHAVHPEGNHRILWNLKNLDDDLRRAGPRRFAGLHVEPLCVDLGPRRTMYVSRLLNDEDIADGEDMCVNCVRLQNRYHTRAQAADLVGCHRDTLKRWASSGIFKPRHFQTFGRMQYSLYNDADVETMKKIRESLKKRNRPQV